MILLSMLSIVSCSFAVTWVAAGHGVLRQKDSGKEDRVAVKKPIEAVKQPAVYALQGLRPFIYEETSSGPPLPMCGPAALRIVCERLGVEADVEDLAREAGTDSTGTTMHGLKRAAEAKGLQAQGLQVDLAYLMNARKPVIAWTGRDHYVVVTGFRGEDVELVDPNQGQAVIGIAEFVRAWDGYVLVVRNPSKTSSADKRRRSKG